MRRIVLIGYMGAGKTTIGKALARKTGLEFFDLDWYVENRYRMKIPQIFAEKGEDGFRELERNMLHEVTEFEDVVISCGGGTPCFFDNIDYMNSLAETVYLKAEPEVLRTHLLMAKSQRPLIQGKTPDELRDFIKESLANREPFYAKAKHIVQIEVLNSREQIDKYVDRICQELAL
ncbi:MAG: shikimate kinase [Bacteroidaceae bacterium]|nr:shikimate kinase [Bacteroidaceae bacterium]